MRSPALAVAWELRQRHRWGLLALSAYFAVLAAARLLAGGGRAHYEAETSFAFAVLVPLSAAYFYFIGIFSFGLSSDVNARESTYPQRMFTLPVTTSALAGWPMLYGSVAAALLWLAARWLAIWPEGTDVPTLWPALLAADLLAWTQALTWLPYPLRGVRVVVTIVWLVTIDAIVMIALEKKVSEAMMLALLAPHLPVAYAVARCAVARARRGEVPHWRWSRASTTTPGKAFRSAGHAQAWHEWRSHGRSLPVLVAILLPCELGLLFVFPETPAIVFETLGAVLLTPPFMAAFVAAAADGGEVSRFLATRPISNAALVATKLRVTAVSTLVTWLVVLVMVPVALRWSGTTPLVLDFASDVHRVLGTPRAIALGLLALAALIVSTWKRLVQSLYIRMSGREWAAKASVFGSLALLTILFVAAPWVAESAAAKVALWVAMPWILSSAVCVKLAAAMWVAIRLRDRGLLPDRTLVAGAAIWSAAVFALNGVLAWIVPSLIARGYFLTLIAILAVPLARLSAAPLALAWSRHR